MRVGTFGLSLFYPIFYLREWGEKTIIYRIKGVAKFRIRVNSVDKLVLWEVWRTSAYFNSDFKIKKDDVIVDIGAHIGAFSVYAAQKASKGKIFAYEPNEENYNMLLENRALNDLNNLFLINLAVTSKKGMVNLFIGKYSNGTHSLYQADVNGTAKAKATTLKEIFVRNRLRCINYLKIDAEGSEYDILLSTPPYIIRKVEKIIIEYHDFFNHGHNYKELKKYLEENGFRVRVEGNIISRRIAKIGYIKAIRAS